MQDSTSALQSSQLVLDLRSFAIAIVAAVAAAAVFVCAAAAAVATWILLTAMGKSMPIIIGC